VSKSWTVKSKKVEEEAARAFDEVDVWRGGVAVGDADGVDLADLASANGLGCLEQARVKASVETHLELDAGVGRDPEDLLDRARLEGDRLFAEDVLAGLGGAPDELDVEPRRRGDDDSFNLRIAEDDVGVRGPHRDAEPLRPILVQMRARDRPDAGFRYVVDQVLGMHPADSTRPDDAHRSLVHELLTFRVR